MDTPRPVTSTDSVRLAMHVLATDGEADDPVLFLHATGFHGRTYLPLARSLSSLLPVTVLAPDLRGHGDSSSPAQRRYSWEGFAEDLLALLEALDLRSLRAFGHSMGGATLLRGEMSRPGSFRSLFLYEPIVFPPDRHDASEESPLVEASRRRRSTFDTHEEAIERFGSKPPLDRLAPEALSAYVRHGFAAGDEGVRLKLPGAEEAEIYRMSTSHDTWDRLDEVRCPVVVARGEATPHSASEIAPEVVRRLPSGSLLEMSTLGHFGPLEDPAGVAAHIRDAWDANLGARSVPDAP